MTIGGGDAHDRPAPIGRPPGASDDVARGPLIEVAVPVYNEARVLVSRLRTFGIKATAARTTDGWTVYVWPRDEAAARGLLDAP